MPKKPLNMFAVNMTSIITALACVVLVGKYREEYDKVVGVVLASTAITCIVFANVTFTFDGIRERWYNLLNLMDLLETKNEESIRHKFFFYFNETAGVFYSPYDKKGIYPSRKQVWKQCRKMIKKEISRPYIYFHIIGRNDFLKKRKEIEDFGDVLLHDYPNRKQWLRSNE